MVLSTMQVSSTPLTRAFFQKSYVVKWHAALSESKKVSLALSLKGQQPIVLGDDVNVT